MSSSAVIVSPIIACLNYIHTRNNIKKRKNELESKTVRKKLTIGKSLPLQQIENVLSKQPLKNITNTIPIQKSPLSRTNKTKTVLPTISLSILDPAIGSHYTPQEVIDIDKNNKNKFSRNQFINHMLQHNLIPVKRAQSYSIFQNNDQGKNIKAEWDQRGRVSF